MRLSLIAAAKIIAEPSSTHRLEVLDLSLNGLSALPPTIGQCTALVELLLCHNQLTCIPGEAGQLSNLRTLDLGRNRCGIDCHMLPLP